MATTEAATIWSPTSGEGEFTSGSSLDIVDSTGNLLVDSSTNNVADSGNIFNPVSATVWATNDGS